MRQLVTFSAKSRQFYATELTVPGRDPMEIHEDHVLRLESGFVVGQLFWDGACINWTLAVADGTEQKAFTAGHVSGYFFPHVDYLPVVVCVTQLDIMEFLKYSEMEAITDRDLNLEDDEEAY